MILRNLQSIGRFVRYGPTNIVKVIDMGLIGLDPEWKVRKSPGSEWFDLRCNGMWGAGFMPAVAAWCEEMFGSPVITKQSRWWYNPKVSAGLRIRTEEDLAWFMLRWGAPK